MLRENLSINVTPGGVPVIIHISQYDIGLRTFVFSPYTSHGTFTPDSAAAATLEGTKPDGNVIIHNCEYNASTGEITYTVQEQLAAVSGKVWSKLTLRDTSGNAIGYAAIIWVVDMAGVEDGAIASDSDISALQEFIAEFGTINAYKAALDGALAAVGGPYVANTVAQMTDRTKVYVYTGTQTGYTAGHWYYWNGSAWTDGGVYQAAAVETDKTLTVADMAADAKATGDAVTELKNDLDGVSSLLNVHNLVDDGYTDATGYYISYTAKKLYPDQGTGSIRMNIRPATKYYIKKDTLTVMRAGTATDGTLASDTVMTDVVQNDPLVSTDALVITSGANDSYLFIQLYGINDTADLKNIAANVASLVVYESIGDQIEEIKSEIDDMPDTIKSEVYDYVDDQVDNVNNVIGIAPNVSDYTTATDFYIDSSASKLWYLASSGLSSIIVPIQPDTQYIVYKSTKTVMRVGTAPTGIPTTGLTLTSVARNNTASTNPLTVTSGSSDHYMYIQLWGGSDPSDLKNIAANVASLVVCQPIQSQIDQLFTDGGRLLVVGSNQAYKTISDACDAASAGDTILVLPGDYYESVSIWGKKLHIVGANKRLCRLIDTSGHYDTPPLEMNIGSLSNMTIWEAGYNADESWPDGKYKTAYCLHIESGENADGEEFLIENCDFRNDIHACIGCGLYQNLTVHFRNCSFHSTDEGSRDGYERATFYYHSNAGTNVDGQRMIVENCLIHANKQYCVWAGKVGGSSGDTRSIFVGNTLYSDITQNSPACINAGFDNEFVLSSLSSGNNVSALNNSIPISGREASVSVNASGNGQIPISKTGMRDGKSYIYSALSDSDSYSIGIIMYVSGAIVVTEVMHSKCNVTVGNDGKTYVWNRDSGNNHTYTYRIFEI